MCSQSMTEIKDKYTGNIVFSTGLILSECKMKLKAYKTFFHNYNKVTKTQMTSKIDLVGWGRLLMNILAQCVCV